MFKQKKKSKKQQFKSVPQSVAVASLAINAILVVGFIIAAILENAGVFDYAVVNNGIAQRCSDGFRKVVDQKSVANKDSDTARKMNLALLDYPCEKNGSTTYYQTGFDDYARSLGLNPSS